MTNLKNARSDARPYGLLARNGLKPIPSAGNLKGHIICKQSRKSLAGASIILIGDSFFIGCSTAIDGRFKIMLNPDQIKGHHQVEIRCLGFERRLLTVKEIQSLQQISLVECEPMISPELIAWKDKE